MFAESIYCEPCLAARLEGHSARRRDTLDHLVPPPLGLVPRPLHICQLEPVPPARPTSSGPNPAVAGILAGFFPFGVGAVYCSQYAKGLAHLLIFVMLIFASDHAGSWGWIFGLGIAFFYVYQIIDAVRTAHALQAGQPAPDPMGLAKPSAWGEIRRRQRCRRARSFSSDSVCCSCCTPCESSNPVSTVSGR